MAFKWAWPPWNTGSVLEISSQRYLGKQPESRNLWVNSGDILTSIHLWKDYPPEKFKNLIFFAVTVNIAGGKSMTNVNGKNTVGMSYFSQR